MSGPVGDSRVEYLYRVGNGFRVCGNRNMVRFGPLEYVTSDVVGDRRPHHRMAEGTYQVTKLRKTDARGVSAIKTVVALHNMDPAKIVRHLDRFVGYDSRSRSQRVIVDETDDRLERVFGRRRWMAKGGSNVFLGAKKGTAATRRATQTHLAAAAFLCTLHSTTIVRPGPWYEAGQQDFATSHENMFYIHWTSSPLDKFTLDVQLNEPGTVFTCTPNGRRHPSLVGIYHDDGLGRGMSGHILYTWTSVRGTVLTRRQVCAIVLGSTFDMDEGLSVCSGEDVRLRDRGDDAVKVCRGADGEDHLLFGDPSDCTEFLYETPANGSPSCRLRRRRWVQYSPRDTRSRTATRYRPTGESFSSSAGETDHDPSDQDDVLHMGFEYLVPSIDQMYDIGSAWSDFDEIEMDELVDSIVTRLPALRCAPSA